MLSRVGPPIRRGHRFVLYCTSAVVVVVVVVVVVFVVVLVVVVVVVVVFVFTLNGSLYPTTSTPPQVSSLILRRREIQIIWSQKVKLKKYVCREKPKYSNQALSYRVREDRK